jgi:hypothetical protein
MLPLALTRAQERFASMHVERYDKPAETARHPLIFSTVTALSIRLALSRATMRRPRRARWSSHGKSHPMLQRHMAVLDGGGIEVSKAPIIVDEDAGFDGSGSQTET